MYNKNIAHRDLKPANILFDDNYRLKVCDMGEAKIDQEIDYELLEKQFEIFLVKSKRIKEALD